MAKPVRLSVVSMSARHPDGRDADYLAWHGLDHLPEQYGIESIVHGQRWVSTPACRAVRAANDAWAGVDHVVQYLFTDPLDAGLDRFFALGAELREAGRMPLRLPMVDSGYEPVDRSSALVRPEVLPWRPCRGAFLVLVDGTLDVDPQVPGVAGWWRYRGGVFHPRLADTSGRTLLVVYLDGDPVETGERLGAQISGQDVLMAAPFVSVVPFEWSHALP